VVAADRPVCATGFPSGCSKTCFADWEEHGADAVKIMRAEDPSGYVRVMVSTLPKEFTVETALADLSDDDIDDLIGQIKRHMIENRPALLIEGKSNGLKSGSGREDAGDAGAAGGD
jgi:hypothetical protein